MSFIPQLLPLGAVGVEELGSDVVVSVSSGVTSAAPALAGGDGQAPPTLEAVREKFGSSSWKVARRTT